MALRVWPPSLQQEPLVDGYSEKAQENRLITEMDAGPPKTRKRFTAKLININMTFDLDAAQKQTLDQFFDDVSGDNPPHFEMFHPIDGDLREFSFAEPPEFSPQGNSPVVFLGRVRVWVWPQ